MTNLTRVTMNLTERDVKNTEKLEKKMHTRSKAEAVSIALSITSSLADHLENGEKLFILNSKGETERLIIPGLDK
jgi:hypothetical protein